MNPNAKITDEQFEAYLKQIRELAEGPFEEIQKEVEVTNTFPEEFYELAKKNDLASYRQALAFITKEDVAKKLFDQIGPKYATRDGGYTRVVRIGPRRGDAAEMAIIQLV